jgi:uncharacterized integral membrane protein
MNFEFEREFELEGGHITLPPPPRRNKKEPFLKEPFLFIKSQWKHGWHLSAMVPFFLLSLLSFLVVVETQYIVLYLQASQPILPSLVVILLLALVTLLLFR